MPLAVSTLQKEGPYQASKWLAVQALLGAEEMDRLLEALPPLSICLGAGVTSQGEGLMPPEDFLSLYRRYVDTLKAGETVDPGLFRQAFSSMWTVDLDTVYAMDVGQGRQLIKPRRPCVQLQMHDLGYSPVDHTFRPMVSGPSSLSWGIQFSYPQIFQDPKTAEIHRVDESDAFPNTQLFRQIQRWLRRNSRPTPMVQGESVQNLPVRLGLDCFEWIHKHGQLSRQGLSVRCDDAKLRECEYRQ